MNKDKLNALHNAWIDADARFQAAVVAKHGKNTDARYKPELDTAHIRELRLAFRTAGDAWRSAYHAAGRA